MATLSDLMDRCIAASAQDGILGATTFRVVSSEGERRAPAPAADADDDDVPPWAHPGRAAHAPASRWVLAIGELA
jgi:hypothetical protein